MTSLLRVFANRRTAALLLLGFASGLPLALTSDTLQAWMKDANVDLGTIGLFGLVGLPYTLKFLWAPLMDRWSIPILGRRRGWLLLTQLLLIAAILGSAITGPTHSLHALAIMALFVAFFSASQDIMIDAYRADVLPENERGAGAAITVTGYRIAMIASGAGALILVGRHLLSWPFVYAVMAAAMAVGLIATLLAPEPSRLAAAPPTLADAVIHPLKELLLRPNGWLVLAFVILFKLPDVMAGSMTLPFMLDIKLSKESVGTVRQGLGILITIAGALVGGGIVARMGLWRSLWLFGILQAVSNLGFWILAQTGPNTHVMIGVIAVENLCAGLVTAGFVAFLMSQCDPRYSATQFALLSSLMAVTRVVGGTPAGYLAGHLGWGPFFLMTISTALPGMLLLPWIRIPPPQALAEPQGFEVISRSPSPPPKPPDHAPPSTIEPSARVARSVR
jgi:PAT family beta-lactamase induction signal transducer AmpG